MRASIISNETVTILLNGLPTTLPRTAPQTVGILQLLNNPSVTDEQVRAALDLATAVKRYAMGRVELVGDTGDEAWYTDSQGVKEKLAPVIVRRLRECMINRVPATTLLAFIDRLYANPSKRVLEQLYPFLEYSGIPITPKGTFLALAFSASAV